MRSIVVPQLVVATLLGAATLLACNGCSKSGDAGVDAGDGVTALPSASPSDGATDGGILSVLPVPASAVAMQLNPDRLPAYTGKTGSVEGTVVVTGDVARATPADFSRCPDAEKLWGHAFREGASLTGKEGARALADAIVVVTGYSGFFIPEKEEAEPIKIEGCGFSARTLTMTFGQRIEIKNESKEFWTPLLEPGPTNVMMMASPHGDPTKLYPKKPGHYLLVDRDRKYAVVDVYAFLHPLHAATDLSGHFRIDGVPVGKLKISTTHPQIDANAEADLTVEADVVAKVDLVLKNVNKDASAPTPSSSSDAGRPGIVPPR